MKRLILEVIRFLLTYTVFVLWLINSLIKGRLFHKTQSKHNRERMDRIRILANGPSLRDEISKLENVAEYDYGMLNDSILTPEFQRFKPKYYFLADPLYFSRDLEANDHRMTKAFNSIDWQITLCVPTSVLNYVKSIINNKNISIVAIPVSIPRIVKIQRLRNYAYKKGWACPPVQNVVVSGIYIAIIEGYKTIELYGVGHSWLEQLAVRDDNVVCLKDVHYYNSDVDMKPWVKVDGGLYKLHEVLRDLAQMFDSYWELRYLANDMGGIKIVNRTKGSWIDTFERQ